MFNYFGEMAVSLGDVSAPDAEILIQHEGRSTIKVFHRDGIVLGAILQRDIMKASLWQKIIEEKISIEPYKADLSTLICKDEIGCEEFSLQPDFCGV